MFFKSADLEFRALDLFLELSHSSEIEIQSVSGIQEIKEWKSLTLKSWVAQGNEKILYQEASLEIFMKPEEIIDFVKEEIQSDVNNSIILCGTPPLIPEQIIYTNKFYCELSNCSGMKISLEYEITRI